MNKPPHPLDVRNGWLFTLYSAAIIACITIPILAAIFTIEHYVR